MNLYRKLSRHPLIFRRITGLSLEQFSNLIKKLRPIWRRTHLNKKKLAGRPYGVGSLENQLLCLLLYYRTYTTQLFIGFNFSVDAATVCRTIKRLEPALSRIVNIKREPILKERELKTLLLDATEQAITGASREYYSGKKKRCTIKSEVIMERQTGKIIQLSNPFPGRVHDITLRRQSDPIPPSRSVYADGGYQGLQKQVKNLKLPIRKPRGKPHTEQNIKHNRSHIFIRNPIERKFREMKIFKILSHIYRNSKESYAIKVAIIAGIVNFKNGF